MPRAKIAIEPLFLVVNKPVGLSSHDAVAILRAVTGIKKIGHTGTLDPFATGVLPLAIGTATRLIHFYPRIIKPCGDAHFDKRLKQGTVKVRWSLKNPTVS